MTQKSTIKRHADLMDRMAGTTGVDLEAAMLEGRLSMDGLYDAVLACTGCTHPNTCSHWLAGQTQTVQETPGYCRNADMLDRLRVGQKA